MTEETTGQPSQDAPAPTPPRRGRPPKSLTEAEPETVIMNPKHSPTAGIADYGVSLDEISRRGRAERGLK
jgi:hypothetical protein